jgi:hypothetical protein
MALSQETLNRIRVLKEWERRVSNMNTFNIPDHYALGEIKGRYKRFTGFIEMWIFDAFGHMTENINVHNKDLMPLRDIKIDVDADMPGNWFKQAQNVAKGKATANNLPKIVSLPASDEDKNIVYETFLPAYRAIKEKFEKRHFWEFITNHARYTAERDALRAIEGVVTTLLGSDKAELDARMLQYKQELYSSNATEVLEQESNQRLREKDERINEERERIEDMERDLKTNIQEEKDKEKEEIMRKSYNELTCNDQANLLLGDAVFKTKTEAELLKTVEKSTFGAKKFVLSAQLAQPLTNAVIKFNNDYDAAVNNGMNKNELDVFVANQAKAMYKTAFAQMRVFKLGLKDRIVAAQRAADIMLNSVTTVAFNQNEYGKYGNKFALQDESFVREVAEENGVVVDDGFGEILNDARKELGVVVNREPLEFGKEMSGDDAPKSERHFDQPKPSQLEKN